MSFSERFCSGFALAATIAGDPGAELARAGLQEAARERVARVARELLTLSKAERRARVSVLARPPRPALPPHGAWPDQARGPLRAYALLAQRAAGTLPPFLRTAPLPRPGFTPEPDLLQLLQRVVFVDTAFVDTALVDTNSVDTNSVDTNAVDTTTVEQPSASDRTKPRRNSGTGRGEPWGA